MRPWTCGILLAAIAGCSSTSPQSSNGLVVSAEGSGKMHEQRMDAGYLLEGERDTVWYVFPIRNDLNREMKGFRAASTSCACTTVKVDDEFLPPGKTTNVRSDGRSPCSRFRPNPAQWWSINR